jgi:hypothetical protein
MRARSGTLYKFDIHAITAKLKVKQEFAAREKAKKAPPPNIKPTKKAA